MRTLKFTFDVWMYIKFMRAFLFMLNKKKDKLALSGEPLSQENKAVIVMVYILFSLTAYHSVVAQVFGILYMTDLSDEPLYKILLSIQDQIIVSTIDFMTLLAFIYLFSYQGQQTLKMKAHAEKQRPKAMKLLSENKEGNNRLGFREDETVGSESKSIANTQDLREFMMEGEK